MVNETSILEKQIGTEGLKVIATSEGMPGTSSHSRKPVEPTPEPANEPTEPTKEPKTPEPAKDPESAKEPTKEPEPSKSQEPVEPTKEPKTPEPANEPAEPQFSKFDFLKEISDGKFSSPEDLKSYLDKAVVPTDERVKGLIDYLDAGGKFENYANIQIQDFDKMSDEDIVKYKMKIDNHSLSSKDIDLLYNKKFAFLAEKDEDGSTISENEETNRVTQIEIKQEAQKSRTHLNELKKQAPTTPPAPKSTGPSEAELAKAKQDWVENIEKEISDFKDIKMDIKAGEDKNIKLEYNINDQGIQKMRSAISNPSNLWNRFMNKDGSVDMNKMFKYFYIAENFDAIAEAISTQSNTVGKETILKEIKHPSQQSTAKQAIEGKVSVEQQAAAIILDS